MGVPIACKSSRILKVLCNIRPPVNSVAVMSLEAVVNATLPSYCRLARKRLIKKVFPVPPRAFKHNTIIKKNKNLRKK